MEHGDSIQSKVSQNEENKYRILTHMWNLENGTDEPIRRAGIETQMLRTDVRTWVRGGWDELGY